MTQDDQVEPSLRRSMFELGGFALLLATWMGVLYWFAGLPDLTRLPAWPGWDAFVAMAASRTASLNGALQVTIVALWAIAIGLATWLLLSVVLELLLIVAEQEQPEAARGFAACVPYCARPRFHSYTRWWPRCLRCNSSCARPTWRLPTQATGPTTEQTVSPFPGTGTATR